MKFAEDRAKEFRLERLLEFEDGQKEMAEQAFRNMLKREKKRVGQAAAFSAATSNNGEVVSTASQGRRSLVRDLTGRMSCVKISE